MRWILILSIALLSQACVNQVKLAEKALESSVYSTSTFTYRGIETYPGKVVCGTFTIRTRYSDKHFKPFIYRATIADSRPSRDDISVFCSHNPVASLYALTGVNFTGDSKTTLRRIHRDYDLMATALKQYQADNLRLPRSDQGLAALLRPSEIAPKPKAFRDGGYLATVPLDPWGRPYLYTGPVFAGVQGRFTTLTLGADGKAGGRDENADVGSDHMKYLDHFEQL